ALEICNEIIDRGLNISWVAFSRANTLTDELAKKMKQAGCKKISFGLESGSQKILDLMKKRATLDEARRSVKLVVENGILAHASFMFGNVGETEETIRQTIKFVKSLPLDNATFFITSPFPGTELYQIAKAKKTVNQDTKWEDFAPLTNTPPILIQDEISKEGLVRWQKRAFREFYLRPKYIISKMRQISSFSALKRLLTGILIFIRISFKQTFLGKKTGPSSTAKDKIFSYLSAKINISRLDRYSNWPPMSWLKKLFIQRMIALDFPQHLFLESTSACNLQCRICARTTGDTLIGNMDLNLFKKIVDEASHYGPRNFCLHLSGEPLLSPNIMEMAEYIKKVNPKNSINLTTNGILLSKAIAEKMVRIKVDKVAISFLSPVAETYHYKTGSDKLAEVENNIRELVKIRGKSLQPKIFVRMIVDEDTESQVAVFVAKWKKEKVIVEVKDKHNYGGNINTSHIKANARRHPCYHLWFSPAIHHNGDVSICCDDYGRKAVIGNVREKTVNEIWNSDLIKKYRQFHLEGKYSQVPICGKCDVWNVYTDMFFPWQKDKKIKK
ncbi:MAG: radical SAM protein, partial [Patescibacteria group bacterium]